MFWPDVIALKEFYASTLGQMVCHAVRKRLRSSWGNVKGDTVLGIGFASPYLTPFMEEAQSVIACMPAPQGVIHWPANARNLSLLCDEAELPFADNSIHRVLVIHAIENSEHARQMMGELWRVLAPTGRIFVVVPNRRGIWARSLKSPFAYGQPFTSWQLRRLLSEHSFTPLGSGASLFFPPSNRRTLLKSARILETLGSYFGLGLGGVLWMEAEKQIYAPITQPLRSRMRREYVPVAQPAGL